jgi:SAM-dependent methyltransferase
MRSSSHYSAGWFARRSAATRRSAEVILPLVLSAVPAQSVVDVGCGLGSWLAVARECGVARILGVDGSYVDTNQLEIPVDSFVAADLRMPLEISESFDLALSLEVGEHLPSGACSTYVSSLVRLAPVVVFSAAVPFQGGTGHVNEQWPSYWADLFQESGYVAVDYVRPRIWDDERVRYFYAQNIILYVDEQRLHEFPVLATTAPDAPGPRSLVHPRLYANALARFPPAGGVRSVELVRFLAKLAIAHARRAAGRVSSRRA